MRDSAHLAPPWVSLHSCTSRHPPIPYVAGQRNLSTVSCLQAGATCLSSGPDMPIRFPLPNRCRCLLVSVPSEAFPRPSARAVLELWEAVALQESPLFPLSYFEVGFPSWQPDEQCFRETRSQCSAKIPDGSSGCHPPADSLSNSLPWSAL